MRTTQHKNNADNILFKQQICFIDFFIYGTDKILTDKQKL